MPAAMAMVAKISDSKVTLLTADSGNQAGGHRDGQTFRFRDGRQRAKWLRPRSHR